MKAINRWGFMVNLTNKMWDSTINTWRVIDPTDFDIIYVYYIYN